LLLLLLRVLLLLERLRLRQQLLLPFARAAAAGLPLQVSLLLQQLMPLLLKGLLDRVCMRGEGRSGFPAAASALLADRAS
jgi:hypothetical protein